jgi:hypothetical protein
VHIRPDGATHLCMFTPPVGNVRRGARLRDMVNSQRGVELLSRVDRGDCPHCWMNCYAPHSILLNPASAVARWFRGRVWTPGADFSSQTVLPSELPIPNRRSGCQSGASFLASPHRSLPKLRLATVRGQP